MAGELSYAPLFASGFREISEDDIESAFVERCSTPQRRRLASTLRLFIGKLRGLGVRGELWIDGSFATMNPSPADIDVVLFTSAIVLNAMSLEQRSELNELTKLENRPYVRQRWNCDLYVRNSASFIDRQYWRDLFSNNPGRPNEPKGIPVIRL